MDHQRWWLALVLGLASTVLVAETASAQAVCLPAPRLLTIMPMGGQAGTTVEVAISGDNLDDVEALLFSHPGLTAVPQRDDAGNLVPNRFLVTIAADCPTGIHEAWVMSRLGISSSRVFHVGSLEEVTRTAANTSLETALKLPVGSICNAVMSRQAVDYYTFEAKRGERIVIDCAAKGIDSKLKGVLIVADAAGNDLQVERRGGALDFTAPEDGTYVVKVHDLTFNGGPEYFYRLALQRVAAGDVVPRLPTTQPVHAFSWPPPGLPEQPAQTEVEPNNAHAQAQRITLPCDISGSFYPAADVDTFEFTASKGEVWWVEVASERLGLPTDPAIIVQHVSGSGDAAQLTDVAELADIPSPVKVSSNGYSYDGPPYNAGSGDILGKLEIKQDGVHRLQLTDLFGGTRSDPRNVYRLIIRKASPDFALVGWALHMELRNGDRNALSKPLALRGGTTAAFEIVVVRRDGFDGEINLSLDQLPPGVTAAGLKIPAGKSRGILLVTADQDAPRGLTQARLVGTATIDGEAVTRTGFLASMAWPIPDASQQIPSPRLLTAIPVSVGGSEYAPVTVAAADDRYWEVKAGDKLTIPLVLTRRCEFSGLKMGMRTFGDPFEGTPEFDVPLDADAAEAVLDLSKTKAQPGEYTIAFYGSAVAKYRYNPEAVTAAERALQEARARVQTLTEEVKQLTQNAAAVSEDQQGPLEQSVQKAKETLQAAEAAVAAADKRLQEATAKAAPKDTVDIVVTPPIRIRVLPVEEAEKK